LTKKELPKTYMHRDEKTFLKYNFFVFENTLNDGTYYYYL